jgi:hypothetical protein
VFSDGGDERERERKEIHILSCVVSKPFDSDPRKVIFL